MTGKKTILFIVTQSEMGGAQRFILDLAASLETERFQPHIASGPRGGWDLLKQAEERGIANHKLEKLARTPNPWQWPAATNEIRALADRIKPDIVLLNSTTAGFFGAFALRTASLPVIYRIGGWAFNDPRPFWQCTPIVWAERFTARWKDVIVVNSDRDRLQAEDLSIVPRKGIITVHNGLNPSTINFFDKEEARARLSERANVDLSKGFLIGNIANFYIAKAHNVLLSSFARLQEKAIQNDVRLVLVGDGMMRPQIGDQARRLGIEKQVVLTGQIPEARRYLKAFDSFALSSKKEGFPWTILEAAAARVPIVATDVGGVPDFIENGETGLLVAPNDPDAFAAALLHIVENGDLREHLKGGAFRMLRSRFSQHKMVVTFERLFEKLMRS